jgi:hypothetical protein
MTTKRNLAPPTPKPSPLALDIIREIEAFRDMLSVQLPRLSDEDVSVLVTPLWGLYALPGVERGKRLREEQTAAIIQGKREDWAKQ